MFKTLGDVKKKIISLWIVIFLENINLHSKTSLTALTFDLPYVASAECVMCEMKYKVIITSLAFWYPLPLYSLKIAAVFFSFLAERPFIDRTRVGVFGEVSLSRPDLTLNTRVIGTVTVVAAQSKLWFLFPPHPVN